MAVFVSGSDESGSAGVFHHAGWIAPETDWSQFFVPAWKERVLDGPPTIPYLHMTDMRSPSWREEHGISSEDAEKRVDEAVNIVATPGGLIPISSSVREEFFAPHASGLKMKRSPISKPRKLEMDHVCFMSYVFLSLFHVHKFHPNAEKVDFIVERKKGIFIDIEDMYSGFAENLKILGHPELVPLLGEIIPGNKDRVPLQAADLLCWHLQRGYARRLDSRDNRRLCKMTNKMGVRHKWPHADIANLCAALRKRQNEREQREQGIQEV